MSLVLRVTGGFGKYPDGRLRAGPFSYSEVGALHVAMKKWGIRPGGPGTTGYVSMAAGGVMLSAQGEGVSGYLVDSDDLEVTEDDLDGFILESVAPGVACRISGHWMPDPDRMIESEATAFHDGSEVTWISRREIIHADGRREVLHRSAPLALSGQSGLRSIA